jgi:tetratricopeptide (TPR) repeat protein
MGSTPLPIRIYNPALLKKDDLIRGFVARQATLERLLDDLRRESEATTPQHHLIVGQRGFGKTMLLRRLGFAVEDDPILGPHWMPLVFPEEQYNVANLGDFWLNCADALSDALDRWGNTGLAEKVDRKVTLVQRSTGDRTGGALEILIEAAAEIGKRFLLLVDNIDLVLDRLNQDDQWAFRRTISEQKSLHFVGSSSRVLESLYEYNQPFYEFFQIIELKGLDEGETVQTLQRLAEESGDNRARDLIASQRGRIRSLHVLTGGNPRTLLLLYRVLSQGPDGDVQHDLESLLDEYTPLYKARFEELPAQLQQVVDAMAIHWDPITAGMLAERLTHMTVNLVSAQLKRLEDFGVIEKTPWYGEKKAAFQLSERLFNIWYLMRASRRVRQRLVWLIRFLETWFDQAEIEAQARRLLVRIPTAQHERFADLAFAFAQLTDNERLRRGLETQALRTLVECGLFKGADLTGTSQEVLNKGKRMARMCEMKTVFLAKGKVALGNDAESLWRFFARIPWSFGKKATLLEPLLSGDPEPPRLEEVTELITKLSEINRGLDLSAKMLPEVGCMYSLLESGEIEGPLDLDGVLAAAETRDLPALPYHAFSMAIRIAKSGSDDAVSEQTVQNALERLDQEPDQHAAVLCAKGDLKAENGDVEGALELYRSATICAPNFLDAWRNIGIRAQNFGNWEVAESALRTALELAPDDWTASRWLGILLGQAAVGRSGDSVEYLVRAIQRDPEDGLCWGQLALAYASTRRWADAEAASRKAIDLRFEDAGYRIILGLTLALSADESRRSEAEGCLTRGISALKEKLPSAKPGAEINGLRTLIGVGWLGKSKLLDRDSSLWQESVTALLNAREFDIGDQSVFSGAIAKVANAMETSGSLDEALALAARAHKLDPDSADARFVYAACLALSDNWGDARRVVEPALEGDKQDQSLAFFRCAIKAGRLNDAIQLMERTEASERMRPLYTALLAVREGTVEYLRRFAPEIAGVAGEIMKRLTSAGTGSTDDASEQG